MNRHRPRASTSRTGRRPVAALSAAALAMSLLLSIAAPISAAPGTRVNVEPELQGVELGQTVVLTAVVQDANGNPSIGPDSNTQVRWYFVPGSPNDIDSPGNSPDLSCHTDEAGTCSVVYLAAVAGTDRICAIAGGTTTACDETVSGPEWDDHVDVVERIVADGAGPTPTPTPTPPVDPTPTPTPTPSVDPTPTPTVDPTPTPTVDPTPTPTVDPTPTPTVDPTPTLAVDPTPTVDPTPSVDPTQTPAPTPTPTVQPTPTVDPTPTPSPDEAKPTPTGTPTQVTGSRGTPPPVIDEESVVARPGPSTAPDVPAPLPATSRTPDTQPPSRTPHTPDGALVTPPSPRPEPEIAPAPAGPAPTTTGGPVEAVGRAISVAAAQVGRVVQPAAALAVATEFGFPLLLAGAVLAYLLAQGYVDRRDPKLRMAPQTANDGIVAFRPEEQL